MAAGRLPDRVTAALTQYRGMHVAGLPHPTAAIRIHELADQGVAPGERDQIKAVRVAVAETHATTPTSPSASPTSRDQPKQWGESTVR